MGRDTAAGAIPSSAYLLNLQMPIPLSLTSLNRYGRLQGFRGDPDRVVLPDAVWSWQPPLRGSDGGPVQSFGKEMMGEGMAAYTGCRRGEMV